MPVRLWLPLQLALTHLIGHFGEGVRLVRLTTDHVEAYKASRLEAGAAPATVNRELANGRTVYGPTGAAASCPMVVMIWR